MSFLQYLQKISFVLNHFIAATSDFQLVRCFPELFFINRVHKFSMGFKSGHFLCQSNNRIF